MQVAQGRRIVMPRIQSPLGRVAMLMRLAPHRSARSARAPAVDGRHLDVLLGGENGAAEVLALVEGVGGGALQRRQVAGADHVQRCGADRGGDVHGLAVVEDHRDTQYPHQLPEANFVAALGQVQPTANSSPPSRPTAAPGPAHVLSRSAVARGTVSPAAWLSRSLTSLKWSWSTRTTTASSPWRRRTYRARAV